MSVLYRWARLKSWHLTRDDEGVTLCGRSIVGPSSGKPDGEPTCDRCRMIREADG